ncbi:hypothetical protein ABZ656_48835 [Streptomyces sp. NPDC007095]|uniref:hypothetical protein n=1 Tax=Streptomyces sp. NPDC007095 TaxID=3154482 RepID=UPI00340F3B84
MTTWQAPRRAPAVGRPPLGGDHDVTVAVEDGVGVVTSRSSAVRSPDFRKVSVCRAVSCRGDGLVLGTGDHAAHGHGDQLRARHTEVVEQAGGVLGQVAAILVDRPASRLSKRMTEKPRPTQPSIVAVRPVAQGDVASYGS